MLSATQPVPVAGKPSLGATALEAWRAWRSLGWQGLPGRGRAMRLLVVLLVLAAAVARRFAIAAKTRLIAKLAAGLAITTTPCRRCFSAFLTRTVVTAHRHHRARCDFGFGGGLCRFRSFWGCFRRLLLGGHLSSVDRSGCSCRCSDGRSVRLHRFTARNLLQRMHGRTNGGCITLSGGGL